MASKDQTRRSRTVASEAGYTLIETLLTVAITAILVVSLMNVLTVTMGANDDSRERNALARESRFAMGRMVRAVERTRQLLLPMADNPDTGAIESVFDPGVLAVTMDPALDSDLDGIMDADNDGDGLVDEDLPGDTSNDNATGLIGIDDDNNGTIDEEVFGNERDDDESGLFGDEDELNGFDDDGDGTIDEDPGADMNDDGAPGVAGVDDDGDGSTDEGDVADDDEDGSIDEDWLDAVVYFLSGTDLIERHPNPSPTDGTDYSERVIAANVSSFRVERLPRGTNRVDLVDILIGLSSANETVVLQRRVRVGGPE